MGFQKSPGCGCCDICRFPAHPERVAFTMRVASGAQVGNAPQCPQLDGKTFRLDFLAAFPTVANYHYQQGVFSADLLIYDPPRTATELSGTQLVYSSPCNVAENGFQLPINETIRCRYYARFDNGISVAQTPFLIRTITGNVYCQAFCRGNGVGGECCPVSSVAMNRINVRVSA